MSVNFCQIYFNFELDDFSNQQFYATSSWLSYITEFSCASNSYISVTKTDNTLNFTSASQLPSTLSALSCIFYFPSSSNLLLSSSTIRSINNNSLLKFPTFSYFLQSAQIESNTTSTYDKCDNVTSKYCQAIITVPLAIVNPLNITQKSLDVDTSTSIKYTQLSSGTVVLETSSLITQSYCTLSTESSIIDNVQLLQIGHLSSDYRVFVYQFIAVSSSSSSSSSINTSLIHPFISDITTTISCQITIEKSILSPYLQLSTITDLNDKSYPIWKDETTILYRNPNISAIFSTNDCINEYTDLCTIVLFLQNSTNISSDNIYSGTTYNISSIQYDNIIIIDSNNNTNVELTSDELSSIRLDNLLKRPLHSLTYCSDDIISTAYFNTTTKTSKFYANDLPFPRESLRCQQFSVPIETTKFNYTQQYNNATQQTIITNGFPFTQTILQYPTNIIPRYSSPLQFTQLDDCYYLEAEWCKILVTTQHYGPSIDVSINAFPFGNNIYTYRCTPLLQFNQRDKKFELSYNPNLRTKYPTPITYNDIPSDSDITSWGRTLENCTVILQLKRNYILDISTPSSFTSEILDDTNVPSPIQITSYTSNSYATRIFSLLPWSWTPYSVVFTTLQYTLEPSPICSLTAQVYCSWTVEYPAYIGNYTLTQIAHGFNETTQQNIDPSTQPFTYLYFTSNPLWLMNTTISFPDQQLVYDLHQTASITTTNVATNMETSSSYVSLTPQYCAVNSTYQLINAETSKTTYNGSPITNSFFWPSTANTSDDSITYFFCQAITFAQPVSKIFGSHIYSASQTDTYYDAVYNLTNTSITITFSYQKNLDYFFNDSVLTNATIFSPGTQSVSSNHDVIMVYDTPAPFAFDPPIKFTIGSNCVEYNNRFCTFSIDILDPAYIYILADFTAVPLMTSVIGSGLEYNFMSSFELIDNTFLQLRSDTFTANLIKLYSPNQTNIRNLADPFFEVFAAFTSEQYANIIYFLPPYQISTLVNFAVLPDFTFDSTCTDYASPICLLNVTITSATTLSPIKVIIETQDIVNDTVIMALEIPGTNVFEGLLGSEIVCSDDMTSLIPTITLNTTSNTRILTISSYSTGNSNSTDCQFRWLKQPFSPQQFMGRDMLITTIGLQDVASEGYRKYWNPSVSSLFRVSSNVNCITAGSNGNSQCTMGIVASASTNFPLFQLRGELMPDIDYQFIIPNKRYFCYTSQTAAENAALSSSSLLDYSTFDDTSAPSGTELELSLIDVCAYYTTGSSDWETIFTTDNATCIQEAQKWDSQPRTTRLLQITTASHKSITSAVQCYFSFSTKQSKSYVAGKTISVVPYDISTHSFDSLTPQFSNLSLDNDDIFDSWRVNQKSVSGTIINAVTTNMTRFSSPSDTGVVSNLLKPRVNVLSLEDYPVNNTEVFVSIVLPAALYGQLLGISLQSNTYNQSSGQILATTYTLYTNNTAAIDILDTFATNKVLPCYEVVETSSNYYVNTSNIIGLIYPKSLAPLTMSFNSIPDIVFDLGVLDDNVGLRFIIQDIYPPGTKCSVNMTYNLLYPTNPASVQHNILIAHADIDENYAATNVLTEFITTLQYPIYVNTAQVTSSSSSSSSS